MSQVKVKENESLDSALRRFKRQTSRDGIIQEVRKREHYEKPSVARKRRARLLAKESISKQLGAKFIAPFVISVVL